MKTQQIIIQKDQIELPKINIKPHLIFVFLSPEYVDNKVISRLRSDYKDAVITGCTTSGEISALSISDTITVTLVEFENTKVVYNQVIVGEEGSLAAGQILMKKINHDNLKHVMVFSQSNYVNGSELVKGLNSILCDRGVSVTGGLAGDGYDFETSYVVTNDGQLREDVVATVGFYSDTLKVGCGSVGGWSPFGINRIVTHSKGNVLYEIDRQPALDLYKTYLGDKVDQLPSSALLFPLNMIKEGEKEERGLVRTILAVNEEDKSLTFSGDIEPGSTVKFMRNQH